MRGEKPSSLLELLNRLARVVGPLNLALIAQTTVPDRLAEIPELANYECFVLDGALAQDGHA